MELTKKETEALRGLFWNLQEAQGALQQELEEIARAHGADLLKETWVNTPDWCFLRKVIR